MTIWDVGNSPIVVDSEDRTREPIPFTSSNLELVDDDLSWPGPGMGLRLNGLDIPQGARITDAYIQFQVEGANTGAAALQIFGEDTDNGATFARHPTTYRPHRSPWRCQLAHQWAGPQAKPMLMGATSKPQTSPRSFKRS